MSTFLNVKLCHELAQMPERKTPHSAGFDLYACESGVVAPGAHAMIPTGVAIELGDGWYGRIAPRSGLATKYGLNVHAGVIDPDFRGPISVALINHGSQPWEFRVGDRIAQLVIEWHFRGELNQVAQLSATERGAGAFGHTGV